VIEIGNGWVGMRDGRVGAFWCRGYRQLFAKWSKAVRGLGYVIVRVRLSRKVPATIDAAVARVG
jgi:hypothetical protein